MQLSLEQQAALDRVLGVICDPFAHAVAPTLVIRGAAGTGKTLLLAALAEQAVRAKKPIVLLGPTGRAVQRIRVMTRRYAQTIHQYLYGAATQIRLCPYCQAPSPDRTQVQCVNCQQPLYLAEDTLMFQSRRVAIPAHTVVFVDEAGMVGPALYQDLVKRLPPTGIGIFVGDPNQLPPIPDPGETESRWGPNFDAPFVDLKTVHRQKEQPILDVATRIRLRENLPGNLFHCTVPDPPNGEGGRRVRVVNPAVVSGLLDWWVDQRNQQADACLITYTNAARHALNHALRHALGLTQRGHDQGLPLVVGDRLLVRMNQTRTGRQNGDIVPVAAVQWPDSLGMRQAGFVRVWTGSNAETEPFLVCVPTMGQSRTAFASHLAPYVQPYRERQQNLQRQSNAVQRWFRYTLPQLSDEALFEETGWVRPERIVHVDFGEVITCHAAQGSQWQHVGIIWDDAARGLLHRDPEVGYRWAYTAVTRAQGTLCVFVFP